MPTVLYKWPEHQSLPSLSTACIQVEAYLRLAQVDFTVQECATTSSSPTGQLPALEHDSEISQVSGSDLEEFEAARLAIVFAKKNVKDLDAALSAANRAELLAFQTLIQTKLDRATYYAVWGDKHGFNAYQQAAYGKNPFPLNYVIPWARRWEAVKHIRDVTDEQAYSGGEEVLQALADRLRGSGGPFFFGTKPSSLDALLLGHLMFYKSSPMSPPPLRSKVEGLAVLSSYVENLMQSHFGHGAPRAVPSDSWGDAFKARRVPRSEPSEADQAMWRRSRMWLLAAGSAILAYVVLGGKYMVLQFNDEDGGEEEDDEEEAGDQ